MPVGVRRGMTRIAEDFWANVDVHGPDECWLWKRGKNTMGYGVLYFNRRMKLAHRHAYELVNGPIPDGLDACHRCDTPLCVNPAHLWVGTHKENMHDRNRKGRTALAKLTYADAAVIRQRVAAGEKQSIVARDYGVTQPAISHIVNGKVWIDG